MLLDYLCLRGYFVSLLAVCSKFMESNRYFALKIGYDGGDVYRPQSMKSIEFLQCGRQRVSLLCHIVMLSALLWVDM
jgi:hypothetical protein